MTGKYLLTTLGCKVNQYESEQLREVLESFGLRPAQPGDVADVAVVNTCAVTAAASRKSRQAIRRVARGGRTPVVLVGCGATADAERLRELAGVTAVLGHDVNVCDELRNLLVDRLGGGSTVQPQPAQAGVGESHRRPSVNGQDVWMKPDDDTLAHEHAARRATSLPISDISTPLPVVKGGTELAERIERFAGRQRAFLKVQDGCDAHCTYCIIPQLRPLLRSKPIAVAVAEASDLVRAGHKEIILTGIFLGAYGRDTALRKRWSTGRSPLASLVEALAGVDGLRRLRLSSLEPGDVDEDLLEVLAAHENCVPHLHLPLQSGSGEILRRMNRQYTREAFMELVDRVRHTLDRPAITTDVIVGFPGETEADFHSTVEMARYAGFCKIHAFPFSPRDRTAAARWTREFVPHAVVRERMRRLGDVEAELSLAFRQTFVGEIERVIVERSTAKSGGSPEPRLVQHGRTDRYFAVHFEDGADPVAAGDIVDVRIDRATPGRTHGTVVACPSNRPERVKRRVRRA